MDENSEHFSSDSTSLGVLNPFLVDMALDNLIERIQYRDYHPTSGFQGTAPVLESLVRYGKADVAYKLLLQKGLPSWQYYFEVGLTEPPEGWGSVVPNREGSVFDGSRFNVFDVFAPIPQWFYQNIGGIQPDPENPGFKHVVIKPQIGGNLSCAETSYNSINGEVRTHWWIEDRGEDPNRMHLKVTVPINTTATVYVPGEDLMKITEDNGDTQQYAHLAAGVEFDHVSSENSFVFVVQSGEYEFTSESEALFPFSCFNECEDCLDCAADDGAKPCFQCNPDCEPSEQ